MHTKESCLSQRAGEVARPTPSHPSPGIASLLFIIIIIIIICLTPFKDVLCPCSLRPPDYQMPRGSPPPPKQLPRKLRELK